MPNHKKFGQLQVTRGKGKEKGEFILSWMGFTDKSALVDSLYALAEYLTQCDVEKPVKYSTRGVSGKQPILIQPLS